MLATASTAIAFVGIAALPVRLEVDPARGRFVIILSKWYDVVQVEGIGLRPSLVSL